MMEDALTVETQDAPILVVDDNMDAARSLALLLKIEGYDVETAGDGISALDAARTIRPRVVVLDISLPDIDGYLVAARLREDERTAGATIIAVSGYDSDSMPASAAQWFDHRLVKPVDADRLLEIVSQSAHRGAST